MAMEIFKEFFEEKIIEIKMSHDSFETVGNRPSWKNDLPVPRTPVSRTPAVFSQLNDNMKFLSWDCDMGYVHIQRNIPRARTQMTRRYFAE